MDKKEIINSLKSEMRMVTNAFNLKILAICGKCGNENEVDYFDYFASIFIVCPYCGYEATFEEPIILNFDEMPLYKRKFMDGHFKIMQLLTIRGVNFSKDITEEQVVFFDYNWDFANGVVDIYTSYEMFLYELTFKKLEELVDRGERINKDNPKFTEVIRELAEKINSTEISKANIILEGIEKEFRVKDCIILLKK